jgi:hypothetical protein
MCPILALNGFFDIFSLKFLLSDFAEVLPVGNMPIYGNKETGGHDGDNRCFSQVCKRALNAHQNHFLCTNCRTVFNNQ